MAARTKIAIIIAVGLATAAAAGAVMLQMAHRDPFAALAAGGRPAWAAEKLKAMTMADPADYRAQSWLVRLDLEAGRMDAAQSRLSMMRVKAPDIYYTHLASCLYAMKRRDMASAAKECSRALDLAPARSAEDLDLASSAMLANGQIEAARPLLEELQKKRPDDPRLVNNLGYYYMERSQNEKALAFFQQALKADPDLSTARRNLARTYMQMGQYQDSIAAYKLLLDKAPTDVEAATELATMYAQKLKDAKNARYYYELAVKNGLPKSRAVMLYPSILSLEQPSKGEQSETGQPAEPAKPAVPDKPAGPEETGKPVGK